MLRAKNSPVGDLSLVLYEMFGENCRATRRTKSERHVSSVNHCVVNGQWQTQLTMTDHLASVSPSLWSTTDSLDTAVSVSWCRKDTLVQAFVSSRMDYCNSLSYGVTAVSTEGCWRTDDSTGSVWTRHDSRSVRARRAARATCGRSLMFKWRHTVVSVGWLHPAAAAAYAKKLDRSSLSCCWELTSCPATYDWW